LKIGFFDSGIGGLSVLHHALQKLPAEQFLYYADVSHVPYGEKSEAQILSYVDAAVDYMLAQGVKAVVLACNTATSVAAASLRRRCPLPVIGMEPAVKRALDLYGERRVLVAATPITVRGEKLRTLIERVDSRHLADMLPLPELVRFAEAGIFDAPEVEEYLRGALAGYELEQYSSLVLGCTHFNFFKDSFRRVLPESVKFVDGNEGTVNQLIRELDRCGLHEHGRQSVEYHVSGKYTPEHISALFARLDAMSLIG